VNRVAAIREPAPFDVKLPPSPYPGLRPFEPHEWPIFFGREPMTREVVARLLEQNLVVVHGDSGCGKSSLIRAGVLVQLEQQHERGGQNWLTCGILPRAAPLWGLAEALAGLREPKPSLGLVHQIRRILNTGRAAVAKLEKLLCTDAADRACILVDQFEELFRFATETNADEARLFVDVLIGLLEDAEQRRDGKSGLAPVRIYAILTMRSEFLGVCARFKGLAEAVNRTQYLLPQMARPALLRAIRAPATLYDGELSRELAERLIADAGGGQDQLPLIQHGLMVLWRRKIGAPTGITWAAEGAAPFEVAEAAAPFRQQAGPAWRLGLEDYRGAGGIAELLSKHADDVMAEVCRVPGAVVPDPKRQKIVEHLFRALTHINAEGNAVRRPQTLDELRKVTGGDEPMLRAIIDGFRADGVSFLTPYGDAEIKPDTPIDISHEALIRCWRKIADEKEGWLQREFQDGLIWQSLQVQAGKFAENKKQVLSPAATEYSDRWLKMLPNEWWTERYHGGWGDVQALMAASREEAERQREIETERRREAEERADQQARLASRLGYLSIALALVVLVAALAGWLAWQQRQFAETQRLAAEEQRRVAEEQKEAAVEQRQLAQTQRQLAEEQRQQAEAQKRVAEAAEKRRTDELFQSQITHAALLAEGEDYARAREMLDESRQLDAQIAPERRHARDFLARYLDTVGGGPQQVYEGAGAPLLSVAVSPDGALLAAGGENGTVVLFDLASGAIRQRLEGHSGIVFDVAYHPEGAWLVTGGEDGKIIRWSLPTSNASAKQAQAWEASAAVLSVAVSPDGRLLATGGADNDISLWEAETGQLVLRLEGHAGLIAPRGLGFSPSGQRLASASYDGTARVWDVATGESVRVFGGHSDAVTGVVFADDSHIATISGKEDRRAAVWDVESGRTVRVLAGHLNGVNGIKYLTNGSEFEAASVSGQETRRYLVTGSFDRTLRVWDMDTGVSLKILEGHLAGVTGVAVHTPKTPGAATQVFSASNDGTVRRWDILPLPYQYLLDVPGEAKAAAIRPDGTHVAVGFDDGSVRLYTLPAGRLVGEVKYAHEATIKRLVFSADGAVLASASFDNSAKLWSVTVDGELTTQQTFTGHAAEVHGITLSPDGKTLATASYDGRIGLFKIGAKDDERFIDAHEGGHEGGVESVALDTNRTRLLSAGYYDKTARLWDLTIDPPSLIREFKQSQVLLWAALSPDNRLIAAVGRGATVDIYKVDDGELLYRLAGHEQTVYRAIFSPDGRQLATVSTDATVRLWDLGDLHKPAQLFALRLPADRAPPDPLWDFDFRCTPNGCWLAVPLTRGKLALYDLGPYVK
jgi:WD40 repeat protein/energy-coupling factor transporter ATP-binding protein EcfA2